MAWGRGALRSVGGAGGADWIPAYSGMTVVGLGAALCAFAPRERVGGGGNGVMGPTAGR